MPKGRQRYVFTVRRGQDGGYALELDTEPRSSLSCISQLLHFNRLFVAATAKEVGDKVAELLAEGEGKEDD